MRPRDSIVSWLHFGDLHMTRAGTQLGPNRSGRKW
jgi:hypothetical protein